MKLAQINRIRNRDFRNMWYEAIQFVLKNGVDLCFGSINETKHCKDSIQEMIITGNALVQVEDHIVHPQYNFGGKRLEEYCKEFTNEFLQEYNKRSSNEKFDYLYYERFKQYSGLSDLDEHGTLDQLQEMKELLKKQRETEISSNYNQAITWEAERDGTDLISSPCLQRIWIRWYKGDYVDVHYSWRSRDLFGAWPSNIIALTEMLNKEVVRPNKCRIARIIDYSDSLHIYERDLEEAKLVKEIKELSYHG